MYIVIALNPIRQPPLPKYTVTSAKIQNTVNYDDMPSLEEISNTTLPSIQRLVYTVFPNVSHVFKR